MFGTVRIGDKATVYWRECGEALSLFVARADGLSALAVLVARLARPVTERHLIAVTDRAESIALIAVGQNIRRGLGRIYGPIRCCRRCENGTTPGRFPRPRLKHSRRVSRATR